MVAGDVRAQASSAGPLADRPVTLVVPFAPGGGTDILARLIAERLRTLTNRTVVVDNKPGANGVIASQFVERSRPDGHTLMLGSSSTHVLAPILSPDKGAMDAVRKSFVPISIVARTPLVLAVSEKSQFKELGQFLSRSDIELTYGTFGARSSPHLMGALLAAQRGLRLVHVPYKGSAPAITDLISGNINSVLLTVAAVRSQVEAGQLRSLAVTGTERVSTLPDTPTFQESGVAGLEDAGWFAIFAPSATPENVVAYLRGAIREMMALPEMQTKLKELGLQAGNVEVGKEIEMWHRSIAHIRNVLGRIDVDLEK